MTTTSPLLTEPKYWLYGEIELKGWVVEGVGGLLYLVSASCGCELSFVENASFEPHLKRSRNCDRFPRCGSPTIGMTKAAQELIDRGAIAPKVQNGPKAVPIADVRVREPENE